jgi:tRNA G26 N,N-dimethylase Trm1
MIHAQQQPRVVEHPPFFCAHCGAAQTKSLIVASPPTPTVCMACNGAVVLIGPIWMPRLSELSPEAHAVGVIRMALSQVRPALQRTGRMHS